jgi:hypothetical protein
MALHIREMKEGGKEGEGRSDRVESEGGKEGEEGGTSIVGRGGEGGRKGVGRQGETDLVQPVNLHRHIKQHILTFQSKLKIKS